MVIRNRNPIIRFILVVFSILMTVGAIFLIFTVFIANPTVYNFIFTFLIPLWFVRVVTILYSI